GVDPNATPDVGAILGDTSADAAADPAADKAAPDPNTDQAAAEAEQTIADLAEAEEDTADLLAKAAVVDAKAPVEDWVKQIKSAVDNAESLEALQRAIANLYPKLNGATFAEVMAQQMAIAQLAGRYEVIRESSDDVDFREYARDRNGRFAAVARRLAREGNVDKLTQIAEKLESSKFEKDWDAANIYHAQADLLNSAPKKAFNPRKTEKEVNSLIRRNLDGALDKKAEELYEKAAELENGSNQKLAERARNLAYDAETASGDIASKREYRQRVKDLGKEKPHSYEVEPDGSVKIGVTSNYPLLSDSFKYEPLVTTDKSIVDRLKQAKSEGERQVILSDTYYDLLRKDDRYKAFLRSEDDRLFEKIYGRKPDREADVFKNLANQRLEDEKSRGRIGYIHLGGGKTYDDIVKDSGVKEADRLARELFEKKERENFRFSENEADFVEYVRHTLGNGNLT
ncbi:MAG TPA: DUF935 family protein, partial [Coleofasciculaceae cyanobacterium]